MKTISPQTYDLLQRLQDDLTVKGRRAEVLGRVYEIVTSEVSGRLDDSRTDTVALRTSLHAQGDDPWCLQWDGRASDTRLAQVMVRMNLPPFADPSQPIRVSFVGLRRVFERDLMTIKLAYHKEASA